MFLSQPSSQGPILVAILLALVAQAEAARGPPVRLRRAARYIAIKTTIARAIRRRPRRSVSGSRAISCSRDWEQEERSRVGASSPKSPASQRGTQWRKKMEE
jgi:hypothetical protein